MSDNDPIIPPLPEDVTPEEALRRFMRADGKKVRKAIRHLGENASSASDRRTHESGGGDADISE